MFLFEFISETEYTNYSVAASMFIGGKREQFSLE
jgi:hypothetical protein